MCPNAISAPVASLTAERHGCARQRSGHTVQFYSSDEFLLNELARLVGMSLASGDAAIVVATKQHREGLRDRLQAQGLDLDLAVKQQRYFPLDAADTLSTFMVDHQPAALPFVEVLGGILSRARKLAGRGRVRVTVFGEMVSLLWADGNFDAVIRLEQLWNDLAKRYDFSLACAYPTDFFDRPEHAELFLRVCAAHSTVIPDETYATLNGDDERLRAVARWQQKARALDTEVADHKRLRQELEARIQQRTTELEQTRDELRGLFRRALQTQDEERRRIAFELHDSAAQLLAALAINVGLLERHRDALKPHHAELVSQNSSLVQRLLTEVRTLSYTLHPPTLEVMGVASALHWYVEQFVEHCDIRVTLHIQEDLGRLPRKVEIAIFRIVQESLANASRHSGSLTAKVRISRSSTEVCVEVSDRGAGISPEKKASLTSRINAGVGISGMRERARQLDGTFTIQSDSAGTTVLVKLPIKG